MLVDENANISGKKCCKKQQHTLMIKVMCEEKAHQEYELRGQRNLARYHKISLWSKN